MKDETAYEKRARLFEEGKSKPITGDTHKEAFDNLFKEVQKRSKTFNKGEETK